MAHHRDGKIMFLLEVGDDVFQRRIILELETIPEGPLNGTIRRLFGSDRFREPEEWKSQIDESILVILELVLLVDYLS